MTNFYSIQFLFFLVVSLICYYTILRKKQWLCLLIAGMAFYAFSGVNNFFFLLIVGISTWLGAKVLSRIARSKVTLTKRRVILWGIILCNFMMLSWIKLDAGLLLPLGISFYMFSSIGYLIDVYNSKYEPENNFARYMLFVSYFPQMIQGPINRYDNMKDQFLQQHYWDGETALKALYRIFYGFLKKYAIANIFAGMIANIFDHPAMDYSGGIVVVGILMYSAQQYADFSGGIDVVLGVSELFGIHMTENFKQPYFAISLGDFWRRWHISLGKWMRDYVFYPFALTKPMKKLGKWANKSISKHFGRVLPASIGNLLVFFLVGIWHGFEMHYVVWGLYNGFIIAFSDICAPLFEKMRKMLHINAGVAWYRVFQIIRTFIIVNIGWYFDRIASVKIALYSMKKSLLQINLHLFEKEMAIISDGYAEYLLVLSGIACISIFVVSVLYEKKYDVRKMLYNAPIVIRWLIYLFVIGMILFANTCTKGGGGFMYANF